MNKKYQIAAYYFPNYHHDQRNAAVHGAGWSEWELVKTARPRYPGHRQPRIPVWGYEDESDPSVMAKKIATAADHGLTTFIFDWYCYNNGPYLEHGLENGFLKAANNHRMNFAIMWANHDWIDIHPASALECINRDHHILYPGPVTRVTFDSLVDYTINKYFKHPSYWKINGAPYYSIYDLSALVKGLGGVEETRKALAYFRSETQKAGFSDLHLNQVLWNNAILPGEKEIREPGDLLRLLGCNSFTSYVWIHHVPLDLFPETDYLHVFASYMEYWDRAETSVGLPYYPNVTMGWDSSPRTVQSDVFGNYGYPFTPSLAGNSPGNFRIALEQIKTRMDERNIRNLTINAWNEWTEGSYLEPDTEYGSGYLQAIGDVFGKNEEE